MADPQARRGGCRAPGGRIWRSQPSSAQGEAASGDRRSSNCKGSSPDSSRPVGSTLLGSTGSSSRWSERLPRRLFCLPSSLAALDMLISALSVARLGCMGRLRRPGLP